MDLRQSKPWVLSSRPDMLTAVLAVIAFGVRVFGIGDPCPLYWNLWISMGDRIGKLGGAFYSHDWFTEISVLLYPNHTFYA